MDTIRFIIRTVVATVVLLALGAMAHLATVTDSLLLSLSCGFMFGASILAIWIQICHGES